MPKPPPRLANQTAPTRLDVLAPTPPASTQSSNPATQDASSTASQPVDPMVTKSYRFRQSHAYQFAVWAKMHKITEQEATRLGQLLIMEQYNERVGG